MINKHNGPAATDFVMLEKFKGMDRNAVWKDTPPSNNGIIGIQMDIDDMKNFLLPVPIDGMVSKKSISNVNEWEYFFEDDSDGSFMQIAFDVRRDEDTFFIIGKFVGSTRAIYEKYATYYKEAEQKFPMDLARLQKIMKAPKNGKIMIKAIFKERLPERVKHFEKRQGKYVGLFTAPRETSKGTNNGEPPKN